MSILTKALELFTADVSHLHDPPRQCPHCGCLTQIFGLVKDGEQTMGTWRCRYCGNGNGREPERSPAAARRRLRASKAAVARYVEQDRGPHE